MHRHLRALRGVIAIQLAAAGLAVVGALSPATAADEPPANDDFAHAQPVDLVLGRRVEVVGEHIATATVEPGEPDHRPGGSASNSIWYSVTPSVSGNLDLWSDRTGVVLAVYTGEQLSTLTAVARADDRAGSTRDRIESLPVTAGTTYWVAVAGEGWTGYPEVSMQLAAGPSYDRLSSWSRLEPETRTWSVNAGVQDGEAELWQKVGVTPHATLWWTFLPPHNGVLDLSTAGSDPAVRLAVFRGPYGATMADLAPVALSEPEGAPTATLSQVTVKASSVYYVAVSGVSAADVGRVWLSRTFTPSAYPDNDAFADAWPLATSTGPVPAVSSGQWGRATLEPGEPAPLPVAAAHGSVWFTFVAPLTGTAGLSLGGTTFDNIATLYRGTSLTSLTALVRDRGSLHRPVRPTTLRVAVTQGTRYYVAVTGADESSDQVRVALRFGTRPVVTGMVLDRGSRTSPPRFGISGVGLDDTEKAVWFGGKRAYVDRADDWEGGDIAVIPPRGLPRGPVRVTVSTWAGTATLHPTYVVGRPYITSLSEKVVPRRGGTWMTVRGADFDGTASVQVGGVRAREFRVLRPAVLRVLLPRHAPGRVRVTVRDRWGGAGTSSVTLRYR